MQTDNWTPDKANENPFYAKSPDHWENHRYRAQSNEAKKGPTRKTNPVAHCATCKAAKRERAFEIYDWANDKMFCNDACEQARKDRNED
jgi:hypothetical protein